MNNIANELLQWYDQNARKLPWRQTQDPYLIWVSEIILQQTQVKQGLSYYLNFIHHFPNVSSLANAHTDEVLLHWKGLGYYSRAINMHKAAQQIMTNYNGVFPTQYKDILSLKGIGKYTAAAIVSICFNEQYPAIDGNYYRVLSRLFADDFDISSTLAFNYFSQLALKIMSNQRSGDFNQAIMDIGSTICTPAKAHCNICPLNQYCMSFSTGKMYEYPVKTKKITKQSLSLTYYFVQCGEYFLTQQRDEHSIWKKLYDFPTHIPKQWLENQTQKISIPHQLTHKKLEINIHHIKLEDNTIYQKFADKHHFISIPIAHHSQKSFPKPLEKWLISVVNKTQNEK